MPVRDQVHFLPLLFARSSPQSTFAMVLREVINQINARFDITVPDPTSDAYFPSELIASALDPATKGLAFVPRPERDLVLQYLCICFLLFFLLLFLIFSLPGLEEITTSR